jgi:hypothetical protein
MNPEARESQDSSHHYRSRRSLTGQHSRATSTRHALPRPLREKRALSGLHGLDHALVLSAPRVAPDTASRPAGGHVPPRLLPARRGPRVRDLLDQRPRRRSDGQYLHDARSHPYGRQETWEDSPSRVGETMGPLHSRTRPYRTDGRPIAHWPRLRAGRRDDLGNRPD